MVFGIEFFIGLVQTFGYLGAVLIGFLSSFTLFIPSPAFIAVFLLASVLNPLLLGIFTGIGSAIGEMIGYVIGYGIGKAGKKKGKFKKQIMKTGKLFENHHPDLIIFLFATLPFLPIDAVGIFCGAIKYDKKRFFLIVTVGKIIKFTLIAYAGFYGFEYFKNLFNL